MNSRIARDGDLLKAELSVAGREGIMSFRYPWAWGPANVLDWDLRLNPQIPLVLEVETRAGQADLDFSDVNAKEISLKTSASNINMVLPNHAGQAVIKIEGNAAYSVIHVPSGVAARIQRVKGLSNVEVDLNRFVLTEDGREYRSPDYDAALNRVDIHLELDVSTVLII
jgi:hypothetical protein